jgi:tRNA G18 (ribose-2'-O)-methylase SpoU
MESWDESQVEKPSNLKYNVHGPFQNMTTERVHQIAVATALPVTLMLFNVNGDLNIGMSIRTAAILGCSDVYVVGRRKYDRRSEVGAKNYIAIHRLPMVDAAFFKENRLCPVLIEQGGTMLESFSFKSLLPGRLEPGYRVVFIVGSEADGLPVDFMKSLGPCPKISISQYGVMRSFNVSIAASIVLYEYSRQWRASVAV